MGGRGARLLWQRGGGGGGGDGHLTVPLLKVEDSEGWLHVSDNAHDCKSEIEARALLYLRACGRSVV